MFDIFLLYIILQPIIDVKDGTPYIIVGHMYKLRHGRQVVNAGVLRLFLRLHAIKKGGQVCNTN